MNRALLQLLALNNKAVFRRTLRGVKTVRGALLLLFTLGLIALMIVPQFVSAIAMSGRHEARLKPSTTKRPTAWRHHHAQGFQGVEHVI